MPLGAPWGPVGAAGGAARGPVGALAPVGALPLAVRRGARGGGDRHVAPRLGLACDVQPGPTRAEVPTSRHRASFGAATLLGDSLTLLQKVLAGCRRQGGDSRPAVAGSLSLRVPRSPGQSAPGEQVKLPRHGAPAPQHGSAGKFGACGMAPAKCQTAKKTVLAEKMPVPPPAFSPLDRKARRGAPGTDGERRLGKSMRKSGRFSCVLIALAGVKIQPAMLQRERRRWVTEGVGVVPRKQFAIKLWVILETLPSVNRNLSREYTRKDRI